MIIVVICSLFFQLTGGKNSLRQKKIQDMLLCSFQKSLPDASRMIRMQTKILPGRTLASNMQAIPSPNSWCGTVVLQRM
jgi:hypothetical protein